MTRDRVWGWKLWADYPKQFQYEWTSVLFCWPIFYSRPNSPPAGGGASEEQDGERLGVLQSHTYFPLPLQSQENLLFCVCGGGGGHLKKIIPCRGAPFRPKPTFKQAFLNVTRNM